VGRTYLVAGEERVPWPAVHAAAAAAADTRLRLELSVPRWALHAAGACGDAYMALSGRPSLVGRDKVALGAPRWWLCTAARARLELGWSPQVPLAEGARRSWVWYRAAGWV
jgi:nucleoside-diphosphate-sugar epimerase